MWIGGGPEKERVTNIMRITDVTEVKKNINSIILSSAFMPFITSINTSNEKQKDITPNIY